MGAKMKNRINKWRTWLLYALPVVLFCSYHPTIYLGYVDNMYLEIFLPLIWLVVFGGLSLVQLVDKDVRKNYRSQINKKVLLIFMFPLYATISIFWTKDILRGVLTAGIIWAIVIAIISIRQLIMNLGKSERGKMVRRIIKIFLVAAVFACAICWLQAFFDVVGVSRKVTLICAGCVYNIIGFPHPSGLAVEPQYMGNLLLAPLLLMIFMKLSGRTVYSSKKDLFVMAFLGATLFLTLSRGAILSFGVALMVMLAIFLVKKAWKKVLLVVGVLVASLGVTLCFQGAMAAMAPTTDTFWSGMTKSIHQMTLGVVDLRGLAEEKNDSAASEESAVVNGEQESEVESGELQPVHFDGYIEESTNSRLMMNGFVWEILKDDAVKMLFGVGIGGSVRIVDEFYGLKDVIPNVYLTILLETGICGVVILLACAVVFVRRPISLKSSWKTFFVILLLAYGLSINFFSGVTNVIHIYLLPAVVFLLMVADDKVKAN